MMKNRRARSITIAGLAALLSLTCAMPAYARSMKSSLTGNRLEDEDRKQKKSATMAATVNSAERSRLDFNSLLSYNVRQDIAQAREPKSATHRLSASMTLTLLDRPVIKGFDDDFADELVTFGAMIGGQMTTIANEIDATGGNGPAEVSDLDLSASRGFNLNSIWGAKSSIETTGGVSLPTSLASQYEGVSAIPYASLTWAMLFQGGRYGIMQTVSADYIVNQYEYSPVSREVNSEGSAGYSAFGTIRFGSGFRFRAGGNARIIRHLDGTNTSALSNVQSLTWTDGNFSVTVSHSNGARAEDRETSMWFVDEYRRILSLGLSARF
jgi:hypothetical protein